jgi:alkanesulfonate monooxygenase SsuD/methylene tetrahydromethanopterin reductase-like flavin-dependent oxidoreductase (luciferase family)
MLAAVRYAIHVHNFGPYADPRRLTELARDAEAAGWDGVFLCDHLTARWQETPQPIADPWIAMAAIAAATERVLIGPMVTPLPRRRPWQLASETVTLDALSSGRLVLGVGLGTLDDRNFTPFGEEPDLRVRGRMLDEGLDVLAGLWRGEPFSHEGEHYRIRDATFLPRPLTRPRIPVWVAGSWPSKRPFRRAARWDGVFVDVHGYDWTRGEMMTPAELRAAVEFTLGERTSADPFEVVIGGHSPDGPRATAARLAPYVEAGLTWWVEGIHPAFGSVEQLAERVRRGPPRP